MRSVTLRLFLQNKLYENKANADKARANKISYITIMEWRLMPLILLSLLVKNYSAYQSCLKKNLAY